MRTITPPPRVLGNTGKTLSNANTIANIKRKPGMTHEMTSAMRHATKLVTILGTILDTNPNISAASSPTTSRSPPEFIMITRNGHPNRSRDSCWMINISTIICCQWCYAAATTSTSKDSEWWFRERSRRDSISCRCTSARTAIRKWLPM